MTTDVVKFFEELNAGVFAEKLGHALSTTGGAVMDNGGEGEVTLKFKVKRIGHSQQVEVKHTLTYTRPTARGSLTEKDTTTTPMYVGKRGSLTLFPEDQGDMFKEPAKQQ